MNFNTICVTAEQCNAVAFESENKVIVVGITEPIAIITGTYSANGKLLVTYQSQAVKEHNIYSGVTDAPEKVFNGLISLLL